MSANLLPVVRWPAIIKDPDETVPVSLSAFSLCAAFWQPNRQYGIGDYAWPNIRVDATTGQITRGAIGYVMRCSQAGRSGSREPRWGLPLPGVPLALLDGSVQWTPAIGSSQGVTSILSPVVSSITVDGVTATGLTTSAITVDQNTRLLVDYIGGTLGLDYEVEFSFSIGGKTRVGRQFVQVRQV